MVHAAAGAWPEVEEIKRKLDGRTMRFACEGLEMKAPRAVLRYRLPATVDLHGVVLARGTVSYGLFWEDRPYNIYHWVDAHGRALAWYFNAAAETRIGGGAVVWLDLELDVLVTPDGLVRVLDEDQVPADLAPALSGALLRSRSALADPWSLAVEASRCVRRYVDPEGVPRL